MKSPMKELIETFEEMNTGYNPTIDVPLAISLMRSRLEKEKEVIMDAVNYGCSDWGSAKNAQQYYNKTFNTNDIK